MKKKVVIKFQNKHTKVMVTWFYSSLALVFLSATTGRGFSRWSHDENRTFGMLSTVITHTP